MQATALRSMTRNSGSISRRYTRTRIRASKAEARTGESLLCRPQVRYTQHMPRYRCLPWTGASLDTIIMAATAVVVAHHCPQTLLVSLILDLTAVTTMVVRYTQATTNREAGTMIWSFQNERCIRLLSPHTHQHKDIIQRQYKKRASRLQCLSFRSTKITLISFGQRDGMIPK